MRQIITECIVCALIDVLFVKFNNWIDSESTYNIYPPFRLIIQELYDILLYVFKGSTVGRVLVI